MTSTAAVSWEDAVRSLLACPEYEDLVRNCYYDRPALAAATRYAESLEWKSVLSWLPARPGSVLDVGAGHGITTFALARAGWRVTALEPDPSELVGCGAIRSLCASVGVGVEVVQEFGETLPFPEARFDLVLSRQALHHARDLPRLAREIARVLKPGGRLVTLRDHVISGPAQLPAFLAAHPLHRLYGGENAFTLAQYTAALEGAGLRIVAALRSFESVINYAPHDERSIAEELSQRVKAIPGAPWVVRRAILSPATSRLALRMLSRIDRRPGRLASFVCDKPVPAR